MRILTITRLFSPFPLSVQSDPGDAFNQFWNIMQGMLENLSQPVAFATAPLGIPDVPPAPSADSTTTAATAGGGDEARGGRDSASSSDTDTDEPIFSRFTRKIGISRDLGGKSGRSSRTNSAAPSRNHSFEENDEFEDFLDAGASFMPCIRTNSGAPWTCTPSNCLTDAE